jgi:hypothetical protein
LEIDRKSIARGVPADEADLSKTLAIREATKNNSEAKGRITPASMHLSATASTKAEKDVSKEDELRIVQRIPRILATPIPGGSAEYSWELVPGYQEALEGQPWDPVLSPRFSMKPLVSSSAIDPSIKVLVSCRLEDLDIDDLTPKKRGIGPALKEIIFNEINKAAAIQQIKHALKEAQLEFGALDDRFSRFLVADAVSVEG